MHYKTFLLLVLLAVAAANEATPSTEYPTEEGVMILNATTFGSAVKEFELLLVDFYSPDCKTCKDLEPEYVKVAATLKQENSPIRVAKIDASIAPEVIERLEIEGYPTIKLFFKTYHMDYEGKIREPAILAWIKHKMQVTVSEVSTASEIDALVKKNSTVVVFFGGKDTPGFAEFENLSRFFDMFPCVYTTSKEIKAAYGISEDCKAALIKDVELKVVEFTGEVTLQKLGVFVENKRFPLVLEFDQTVAHRLFGDEGVVSVFLLYVKDEVGLKVESVFRDAALKLKDKIQFTLCNIKDEGFGPTMATYVGITEKDVPKILIIVPSKTTAPKKYALEKEPTVDNIVEFYESYASGTLKPLMRSDPIPEKNDELVKVVVANSFDSIVLDERKDVLIFFYAPWCANCKKFAPIYEKLAKKLSVIPDLVLTKMDATSNDVAGIEISTYPTLKFYASNNKEYPLDFDGERSFNGLLRWVKESISVDYPSEAFKITDEL